MLITFKKLHDKNNTDATEYLLRLGHQYSVNEDEMLSKPVDIDLSQLFATFKLISAMEMTLTGNQKYDDWINSRLDWTGSDLRSLSTVNDSNTTVNLKPMEVRTFVVTLEEV